MHVPLLYLAKFRSKYLQKKENETKSKILFDDLEFIGPPMIKTETVGIRAPNGHVYDRVLFHETKRQFDPDKEHERYNSPATICSDFRI